MMLTPITTGTIQKSRLSALEQHHLKASARVGLAVASVHADQRKVQEPRLRRNEPLNPLAHCSRVEVVHNEEPGRIVHQALNRRVVRSLRNRLLLDAVYVAI